jgi:O-antigen ligase
MVPEIIGPMTLSLVFDRITFFFCCSLVFVLPVTTAGVEISAAGAIFFFILSKVCSPSAGRFDFWPGKAIVVPLALYLGWAMLSISWSHYPWLSSRAFVGKVLEAVCLLLVVSRTVNSPGRTHIFLVVLLTAAGIICLDGFWQLISGHDLFLDQIPADGRLQASFKHSNDFGSYLVVMSFITMAAAGIAVYRLRDGLNWRNSLGVLVSGVLFLMVWLALGLTYSRGAWISLGVASIVFLFLAGRFRLLTFGITGVFVCLFFPLLARIRNVQIISDSVTNSRIFDGSGRMGFWGDALHIIRDHLILGTGLNTYTMVIQDYARVWKAYPHNCYLQIAAELGVAGLALFLWFVAAVFLRVSRHIRQMPVAPDRWCHAALLAGWCGILAHSALDTTLYSAQLSSLFWVLTGFLLALAARV